MTTFKQLETLVQVADATNFGRAGLALGVAQPTISRTIRILEEQFGRRLFNRSSRTAVLNADGHDLLSRAKHLLSQREGIERLLANSPDRAPVMAISVAVPELVAATWLQQWMRAARRRHPQARLSIRVAAQEELKHLAESGAVPLVIGPDGPTPASMVKVALPEIELAWFISRWSAVGPDPMRGTVTPDGLLGQVAIALAGGGAVALPRNIDFAWCDRQGLTQLAEVPDAAPLRYAVFFRNKTQEHEASVGLLRQLGELALAHCDFTYWGAPLSSALMTSATAA